MLCQLYKNTIYIAQLRYHSTLRKSLKRQCYVAISSLITGPMCRLDISFVYYASQFTVETYCFAYGRCLFKQPRSVTYHWNQ